jgi:hypothetical protein
VSELELRFPSDQPYAYFAVRGTPEEIQALDFEMLASLYVNTQFAVLKGTASAKDAILGAKPEPAPEPVVEELPTNPSQSTPEAVTALSEGLGGVTEIDDVNAPPWAGPKPAPKAKPWESEKPKTQVSADDFDF